MRLFNLHAPHFQHFSPHSALVSLRDQVSSNYGVVMVTLTILVGLAIALTFLEVVAP